MRNHKHISLADVLASDRPNTSDKAAERWCYLKSEYQRRNFRNEKLDAFKGFVVIILSAVIFSIAAIAICLKHT